MKKDLRELIEQCIDQAGADAVEDALHAILEERHERTLTIVVNDWQHPLQDVHSRGEIFILSRGSFDYTNAKIVVAQFESALLDLGVKLREKKWTKIYLVPFGPSVLSMQVKLFVYRILHIETTDVLHIGNNKYCDIDIKQREITSKAR